MNQGLQALVDQRFEDERVYGMQPDLNEFNAIEMLELARQQQQIVAMRFEGLDLLNAIVAMPVVYVIHEADELDR